MTETLVGLEFLFARLVHPEGMVRERACTAIARLLNSNDTTKFAGERLASWTQVQMLESVAIFAPLIWIRARIDNPEIDLPNSESMAKSFPRPSLVSWLLLTELYGDDCSEPDWQSTFSHGRPRDFEPDPFFLRYVQHFVPQVYVDTANQVAKETGAHFVDQWAWEWGRLVKELSVVPDEHVLRFRGEDDSDLHVCYDFRISEISRSAYLRTLSWAMINGIVHRNDAIIHAAKCCPIDIGLWRVAPGRGPDWWPIVSDTGETIDESAGQVVAQLKDFWHKQSTAKDGWSLVQASGLIGGKNVHIELEIYGVFQRCFGPHAPDIKEVLRGFRWGVREPLIFDTWVKFSGRLIPWPDSTYTTRKEDWEITPAFTRVETPVVPRWQWWRHYRQTWAPSLCLLGSPLNITVTDQEVRYDRDGASVGRWLDWSWGLEDTRDANLPPATGQALVVRSEHLESFSDTSKSSFCWIWRITGYHRRERWGKYDTFTLQGDFGTTAICRA